MHPRSSEGSQDARRSDCETSGCAPPGEMDIQAVALLSELEDRIGSHMVFCLRGVTFMDAAALGALTKLRRKALSTGGCIRFVAPSGPVLRVLLLTGTGRAFATYDRLSDALLTPVSADPIGPP